jgi:hypothetical protein
MSAQARIDREARRPAPKARCDGWVWDALPDEEGEPTPRRLAELAASPKPYKNRAWQGTGGGNRSSGAARKAWARQSKLTPAMMEDMISDRNGGMK